METTRRDSWRTRPMPQKTAVLDYAAEFSAEEFEKLSRGLVPQEMNDMWFIHLEGNVLNFHRSFSRACIYQMSLAEEEGNHKVQLVLANRDPKQYGHFGSSYDTKLLHFLISNLLLGKRVEFPLPRGFDKPEGLFQASIAGTAYPETLVDWEPEKS